MLLLKGKAGKSIILEVVHKNTYALTYVYYNQPVIEDCVWVNSDSMEFGEFLTELDNQLKTYNCMHYDYLIIYTNKGETSIKNKKELIESWEKDYGFTVIIGCK